MAEETQDIDPKDILENIIANNGSCSWVGANDEICNRCPIKGMLDENGEAVSCLDAAFKGSCERYPTLEEQNKMYKEKALDVLTDIIIEENFFKPNE